MFEILYTRQSLSTVSLSSEALAERCFPKFFFMKGGDGWVPPSNSKTFRKTCSAIHGVDWIAISGSQASDFDPHGFQDVEL